MSIFQVADELGEIKAQIADLKDREALLKKVLVESGYDAVEGNLFRATVSHSVRRNTNWKGIAEKLGASRQIITANTTETETVAVRVSARVAEAA